jgi:hypothetical protein
MPEEPTGFSTPLDEASRVELLLAVARVKGSLLSAKDIEELTSLLPEGSDLGSIWNQIPILDSNYELQSGVLIEKRASRNDASDDTLNDSNLRRSRAERYGEFAREFSFLSGKRWVRVLSVAGSTSYMAVNENDDVDIFCVTENEAVWIYLTKALLLARFFKLLRPRSPRFCFSCVLDETYARRRFASPNGALFARDALTTQVLQGSLFYDGLLRGGQWLSDYFPKLYKLKAQHMETLEDAGVTPPSRARKTLNHFLFLTVGNYVRLKSILLNRKLRKTGRPDSLFTVIMGRDHCIFESRDYRQLRRMYSAIRPYPAGHRRPMSGAQSTQ